LSVVDLEILASQKCEEFLHGYYRPMFTAQLWFNVRMNAWMSTVPRSAALLMTSVLLHARLISDRHWPRLLCF